MPPVNKYRCNYCGLSFPEGWGGYFYVEVDEGFLEKRLSELHSMVQIYNKVLRDIEQYINEFYHVIQYHFAELMHTVQDIIRYLQVVEVRKPERGFIDAVLERLFSGLFTKSLDELEEELNRIKHQSMDALRNIHLIRLLEDLRRYIESRRREVEGLISKLNDIKVRLKASNKQSIRIPCPHPSEYECAEEILVFLPQTLYSSREQALTLMQYVLTVFTNSKLILEMKSE